MEPPMPVNLSVKTVPDDTVQRLKKRAERHHRSLQGELMAILEDAVREPASLSPMDILKEVRGIGLTTPSEAAGMVRETRNGR